jgi:hypothetical protein
MFNSAILPRTPVRVPFGHALQAIILGASLIDARGNPGIVANPLVPPRFPALVPEIEHKFSSGWNGLRKRRCPRAGTSGDGARRIRTADLLGAIQALCQLSYSPEMVDLQEQLGCAATGLPPSLQRMPWDLRTIASLGQ